MAIVEHDREDLLTEATALVERVELRVEGFAQPVVVGFRRGGAASVFFGADPVYQFNSCNELRRVFAAGRLLKADARRLVQIERQRVDGKLQMIAHELSAEASDELLAECRQRLAQVATQLDQRFYQIIGQVPPDAGIVSLVRQWLAVLPECLAVAERPNVI